MLASVMKPQLVYKRELRGGRLPGGRRSAHVIGEGGGGVDIEWSRRLCSLRNAFALRPGMRLSEAMSDQRHPYLLTARNRTARSSVYPREHPF